ncbi:S-adenosyl-L-methionine-dependent methyltransferase-like protein [Phanerochaete sordida]|uniref:S-adenosyl-L-methionine-dependent methyltransferase-like protein n=1 Tax=Phanerochaete sordida TaxID=48140 RepID=A0A9P3LML9_9APHY|nr:S-adenosyl-L-methionine-dependent methyltransferase-like protein [Phanerochaete sordida]
MSAITTLTPPTSSLPPLARLSRYSTDDIDHAIQNLRAIYSPRTLSSLPTPAKALPTHVIHDTSVPDSGYASAEEDSELVDAAPEDGDVLDAEALREDPFERDFAVRWLTGFAARSEPWVYALEDEEDARTALVDAAASLLASMFSQDDASDDDAPEAGLTRTFTFAAPAGPVHVVLNDAPLSRTDHTSVGLQSWGSAIVLAERMCAAPGAFGLARAHRVLELGAGTGLLSLAAAQLCYGAVVATDYHAGVLANLRANVGTNGPCAARVAVHALDWQYPACEPPLDAPFDVLLAADVVYHPEHARWIKGCAARLLAPGGVFWLIIPVRSTGRHEGMGSTVEAVFPSGDAVCGRELAILGRESIAKHGGIGRADESGYTLFRIGWAN